MKNSTSVLTAGPAAGAGEPSLAAIVLIFWTAFAVAAAFTQIMYPQVFERVDPDAVIRLVQVRDLLAGQGWFDLLQYRMDPPDGVLMHWSRLVDAPLAGLVLIGNALSLNGEMVALTLWPLLLLLVLMASNVSAAVALGGRAAGLPALLMTLTFYEVLSSFVPGSIDHHNAQIALMVASLAAALRLRESPVCGLLAGCFAALTLAVGLEALPYLAIVGVAIAAAWALSGAGTRGTAFFGTAFAVAPALLYLTTGSPAAATACDSISWTYALPAAVAGGGLALLVLLGHRIGAPAMRMAALVVLALLAAGTFLLIAPECRGGPYGYLSEDFHALFLRTVAEAQPLLATFPHNPVRVFASITAPALAIVIALRCAWKGAPEARYRWALLAGLTTAALSLSFYQVRAVPYAHAFAVPVLAAWIGQMAVRHGVSGLWPIRRALPVIAAFLVAQPLIHIAAGLAAEQGLKIASNGRIAAVESRAEKLAQSDLPFAQSECTDAATASYFSAEPAGLVLAPLFYGSSVLALSPHSVVAGPYHRGEAATLFTIRTLDAAPEDAKAAIQARGIDYVAFCSTAEEVLLTADEAPDGLLAQLLAGNVPDWLDAVAPSPDTPLRLYRVRDAGAANTQRADTT